MAILLSGCRTAEPITVPTEPTSGYCGWSTDEHDSSGLRLWDFTRSSRMLPPGLGECEPAGLMVRGPPLKKQPGLETLKHRAIGGRELKGERRWESRWERKRGEGAQEEERTLKRQGEGGRYRHMWPTPPPNPRLQLAFLQWGIHRHLPPCPPEG